MQLHYFQHVHFEGPGHIRTWAEENGHQLNGTHFFEPEYTLPKLSSIDGLIVMGGPMSVFDEERYEWLSAEKQFLKEAIAHGVRILGICLGAQLLANVLGAAVKPAPNKEIGWFPIAPTDESKALPWFYELFSPHRTVFHWHADKFEIPFGAINLASSEGNKNQAFAVSDHILALQFHVETTSSGVDALIAHAKSDIVPGNFVQDEAALKQGTSQNKGFELCKHVLSNFFQKNE